MSAKSSQVPTPGPRGNRKLRQRRPLRARLRPALIAQAVRRGARPIAPVLLALVLLATAWGGVLALVTWIRATPRFALADVALRGNTRVTEAEVHGAVARAGAPLGTNLFRLSTTAVEDALLENPWILEARVARRLPRGLEVTVREREAVAVVVAGDTYLADREGQPFKRARVEAGEADGLVAITGISREVFARRPDAASALVRQALEVARAWHATPPGVIDAIRPRAGEIHIDPRGATLYTHDTAVAIALGRARGADLTSRVSRFDAIWDALDDTERARARRIHLDSPGRPDRVTVKLAEATTPRKDTPWPKPNETN